MDWLLALDVGTNSLGWWAYEISQDTADKWDITRSLDGGVRLFPDGREPSSLGRVGDSLAVNRRIARGMRRNRERRKLRMSRLVDTLISLNLLPASADARAVLFQNQPKSSAAPNLWNPYRLRAKAAHEKLAPFELGRALFHLGLRRGYLSNRKDVSDEDGGKLKDRMAALSDALAGRTLGQYLWDRFQEEQAKPAAGSLAEKPEPIRIAGSNPFFTNRAMYRAEFEAIKATQQNHHNLQPSDWDTLAAHILEQRPLKPVERGRCEFFTDQPRHWKDTPVGHNFRIYQELNNLELTDGPLSREQYDAVLHALMTHKAEIVTFGSMRKLKDAAGNRLFPSSSRFNLESEKRKGLKRHRIAVTFKADPTLAKIWDTYHNSGQLDDMFETLFEAENDVEAKDTLIEHFNLTNAEAEALSRIPLSRATSSLSKKAMQQLVNIMRDQGLHYADAVHEMYDEAGNRLHHSYRQQPTFARLPYYGKVMPEHMLGAVPAISEEESAEKHFGRINNPTVHVALNQVRKLVNTLTDRFQSAPVKIHVEMARELKRPKGAREEMERQQAQNEKRNTNIRKQLAELGIANPSATDIKKWKLWEELGQNSLERLCPFTGQSISANQLFTGQVEIEHILPFSRTLDNSLSNLTLAMRWANALKGKLTPYEAFSSGAYENKGIVWQDIVARARKMPVNKAWRFGKTAMERFEKDSGFIARQLTDTAYMARVTTRYLKALEGVTDVVSLPGGLTALVRGKWHLNGILSDDNKKSREDHRHHAVDAAVIGLINRSLLAGISKQSARSADGHMHIQVPKLQADLEAAIRTRVPTILPSFKPDHGLEGKMYKETAYGFTGTAGEVVTRKPLPTLTAKEVGQLGKDDGQIRDTAIRTAIQRAVAANPNQKLDKILADFGAEHGIKRVRILVNDQTVEPVPSTPYKGYKPDSYICCDIWAIPPKKKGGKTTYQGAYWPYSAVSQDADGKPHLNKNAKKPHPAARFITRVFKDDLIETGPQGKGHILRVAGFSTTDNKLDVRDPYLSLPARKFISINQLSANGIRRLYVTPDGRILQGVKP